MQIEFKTLSMSNFMSYGKVPTVIDFSKTGTTLILGEDLDNTTDGQGSNGCGKTSIMNALTYALYDRPISDIKNDDLVNNINGKHLEVIVVFEVNSIVYRVERRRKSGKSGRDNSIKLFIVSGDELIDKTQSAKLTDAAIEEILGMTYDMFVRIVVISATHVPFLDLPVTHQYQANQTDFIERLFNLTLLSEQSILLKAIIKSTEESMNTHKTRIELLEKEHTRFAEQLKSAKQRVINWDTSNVSTIKTLEQQLSDIETVDIAAEQAVHEQIVELESSLREIKRERVQLQELVKRHEAAITKNTNELEHLNDHQCPYCLQQYADTNSKIDTCVKELDIAMKAVKEASTELELLTADIRDTESLVLITKRKKQVDNINQLVEIHSQKRTIQQRVTDLKTANNPFLDPLDELESCPVDPIDYTDINKLKRTQDHQQFLLKLLTKKDSFVRKALLNKNIPFLNNRLNQYLNQLGLRHKVEFTHEMTTKISLLGRSLGFGNLSNGQRARVNLALTLAFRDVLQTLHTPINICLLDESLDVGLDEVGVQSAVKMLKQKARDERLNIFIISHRDGISSLFDRTITVQMQHAFSSLKAT